MRVEGLKGLGSFCHSPFRVRPGAGVSLTMLVSGTAVESRSTMRASENGTVSRVTREPSKTLFPGMRGRQYVPPEIDRTRLVRVVEQHHATLEIPPEEARVARPQRHVVDPQAAGCVDEQVEAGDSRARRRERHLAERPVAADAELSVVEKKIERVRSEFDGIDRKLNDNIRTQQEAVRSARAQHQTVEERKNPAYLNIGRHLASQGIAPPNAPHLLAEAQRRREAVERHLQHRAELALLSSQINKQELRKF